MPIKFPISLRKSYWGASLRDIGISQICLISRIMLAIIFMPFPSVRILGHEKFNSIASTFTLQSFLATSISSSELSPKFAMLPITGAFNNFFASFARLIP